MDILEVLRNDDDRQRDVNELADMPRDYAFCSYMPALRKSSSFEYFGNTGMPGKIPGFRALTLTGWQLPDGRLVRELDDDSARLPILEGVGELAILERLQTAWRPALDTKGLAERIGGTLANAKFGTMWTFLRFPSTQSAQAARKALSDRNYPCLRKGVTIEVSFRRSMGRLKSAAWVSDHEDALATLCQPFGGAIEGNEIEIEVNRGSG
jgi:hypothetical protein